MQANVIVTVHGVAVLDAVQMGELTQEVGISFGARPTLNLDTYTLDCSLTTQNVSRVIHVVEALTVTIALRYNPLLWITVCVDYADADPEALT